MIVLVTGGCGSGKSAYAEERAAALAEGAQKYYVATMRARDEEGRERVQRHRAMREGKGFLTIEQPARVGEAAKKARELGGNPGDGTAVLECVSNLLANEMFQDGEARDGADAARRTISGISELAGAFRNLVIVTNQVFEDGVRYEGTTEEYRGALGEANRRLAALSDEVAEVVVGIPVIWKGSKAHGR